MKIFEISSSFPVVVVLLVLNTLRGARARHRYREFFILSVHLSHALVFLHVFSGWFSLVRAFVRALPDLNLVSFPFHEYRIIATTTRCILSQNSSGSFIRRHQKKSRKSNNAYMKCLALLFLVALLYLRKSVLCIHTNEDST